MFWLRSPFLYLGLADLDEDFFVVEPAVVVFGGVFFATDEVVALVVEALAVEVFFEVVAGVVEPDVFEEAGVDADAFVDVAGDEDAADVDV